MNDSEELQAIEVPITWKQMEVMEWMHITLQKKEYTHNGAWLDLTNIALN